MQIFIAVLNEFSRQTKREIVKEYNPMWEIIMSDIVVSGY